MIETFYEQLQEFGELFYEYKNSIEVHSEKIETYDVNGTMVDVYLSNGHPVRIIVSI